MRKINWNKTFTLDSDITISCGYQKTSYGFRHLATIRRNWQEIGSAKVCYYNRTWERFEYQTVAKKALHNAFPGHIAETYCDALDGKKQDDGGLGIIAGIAKLGAIFCNNEKDTNDWKLRMLKAGLEGRGLDMPDDFDSLPEAEKTRRLDGAIATLTEAI